ncbi:hypothetical protein SAMN05421752_110136 [Natronorubrum thiooxidans]|uniref:Uncharacterized protein n=1 Tax=Natronorubrum thiooxidans TaxID=308853 RepID=A0A1N7G9G6_9EURY|nr:hypothetical protein SAMN05421752_110136 [Natronorubrum thiooxidans]
MATGSGERGEENEVECSLVWVDPDSIPQQAGSTTERQRQCDSEQRRSIDLEFEWYRLCHGCNERKWFAGLICDDCRQRHDL